MQAENALVRALGHLVMAVVYFVIYLGNGRF